MDHQKFLSITIWKASSSMHMWEIQLQLGTYSTVNFDKCLSLLFWLLSCSINSYFHYCILLVFRAQNSAEMGQWLCCPQRWQRLVHITEGVPIIKITASLWYPLLLRLYKSILQFVWLSVFAHRYLQGCRPEWCHPNLLGHTKWFLSSALLQAIPWPTHTTRGM